MKIGWSKQGKKAISDMAKELRQIERRAQDIDVEDEELCAAIEGDWQALYEKAQEVYMTYVLPVILDINSVANSQTWEESDLNDIHAKIYDTVNLTIGPEWYFDDEDFAGISFDSNCAEIGDGDAEILADGFSELLNGKTLAEKDKRLLRKYAEILRKRATLVDSIVNS